MAGYVGPAVGGVVNAGTHVATALKGVLPHRRVDHTVAMVHAAGWVSLPAAIDARKRASATKRDEMKLLAVHPNFELYGSDRAFAHALEAIVDRLDRYDVTALIPREGPILKLPVFSRIKVLIEPFWIPRRAEMKPLRAPGFLISGLRSIWRARARMKGYDLIYVDTIVCLDFIMAARFAPCPVIVHVHEIPIGAEMRVFRQLLLWSRSHIVFNSVATREAFALPDDLHTHIVYNGAAPPPPFDREPYHKGRPLRLMVIGRLNGWKGQEVLVDAVAGLDPAERRRIEVRIVGGVFGDQDHYRTALESRIASLGIGDVVSIHPFADDPSAAYRWADVVVVPSTKPEPFGRVAIEGMAFSCAVIASGHGGLVESVAHEETGLLVPPSDPAALATAIRRYLDAPSLVATHGDAGKRRFEARFTDEASDISFAGTIRTIAAAN